MLLLCRWNTFGGVCRRRFETTGGFCEYRDGFTLRRISKRPFLGLFNAFWPFGHVYRTVFLIPRRCFSGRAFFTNCENFGSRKRAEKIVQCVRLSILDLVIFPFGPLICNRIRSTR